MDSNRKWTVAKMGSHGEMGSYKDLGNAYACNDEITY